MATLKEFTVTSLSDSGLGNTGNTGARVIGPGVIRQADGSVMIYPALPGGVITGSQLSRLAEIAAKGKGIAKISVGQMIGVLTTPGQLQEALSALADAGLSPAPLGSRVRTVRSCSGLLCPNAKQDSVADAGGINALFSGQPTPRPFRMSVSACRNSCAESMLQDVGFIGTPGGYNVYVGGKAGGTPVIGSLVAKGVRPDQMPGVVETVLDIYQREAAEREQLHKVIARIGIEVFEKAIRDRIENNSI